MQIGYIGLGKMGKNMVLNLLEKGHDVIAWNRSPEPRQEVAAAGAKVTETVAELLAALSGPRLIWVMLPAGEVTGHMLTELAQSLQPGDMVIDGANSFYQDTIDRAPQFVAKNIHFADVGVSGGPGGARTGACLMIGGQAEFFEKLTPLYKDLAAPDSYQFFPGYGAGHFVKMVHNGIEYGMMQAVGEGFAVLKAAPFQLDLEQVARLYNHQSVIESRLVGWLESGYAQYGTELKNISGTVKHSGEGQWTIETAKKMGIPLPVIEAAFQFRVNSSQQPSYTGQVVSVLRNQFGGHQVSDTTQS
jgi:6-phosphogluconate dehydrogenase